MSGYNISNMIFGSMTHGVFMEKKVNWETVLLRISGDGWVTIS